MPRASSRPIKRAINQEIKNHFASLIAILTSPKEIEKFFEDFLREEEKIMLVKRLMIHLMLENGYRPSQIKTVLGVSRETIRIHQHIWTRGGEVYRKIIKKIAKKEKGTRFWEKVEKILTPIDLALRSKTDMRARAKFARGDWFAED